MAGWAIQRLVKDRDTSSVSKASGTPPLLSRRARLGADGLREGFNWNLIPINPNYPTQSTFIYCLNFKQ
jgi:hypothetical protein